MTEATENEDDFGQHKKSFRSDPLNWMIIVGILIMVLGWIGILDMGEINYKKTLIGGFGLMLFVMFVKLSISHWQNKSPKLIWENGHSTYGIVRGKTGIGNWVVYRLGGIAAHGIYTRGGDGAIICPVTSKNIVGPSIVMRTFATPVPKHRLPLEVQELVEFENIPPPYHYGLASEEQSLIQLRDTEKISGLEMPTVGYLINEVKEKNELATMLRDISRGKFGSMEQVIATLGRIQTKAERGSIKDALRRAGILEKKKDE